jgi:hypothetical protein
MVLSKNTNSLKQIEYIVKDKSSRNAFTAITLIGLIIATSIFIYIFILPSKTIENLGFNALISAYGYDDNNTQLIILNGSITIHNGGPLDVLLREPEIEITIDDNFCARFPLRDQVSLTAGGSYQYVLAPPDFIIKDEERLIYNSIMDYHIETEFILYSGAVVGGREYSIEKRYSHPLVFLSLPTDIRP